MTLLKPVAALLVLIVTNVSVFAGIAWNRTGDPTGQLSLNQCEINSFDDWSGEEQSVRNLQLRVASNQTYKEHGDLGLDTDLIMREWNKRQQYVVLQHGGPEWDEYFETLARRKGPGFLGTAYSRLIVVDAADDPEPLLQRHTNFKNRVIMVGRGSSYSVNGSGDRAVYWSLKDPWVPIESQHRTIANEIREARLRLLEETRKRANETGEEYSSPPCVPTHVITITWGRRFEPWVSSITAIEK